MTAENRLAPHTVVGQPGGARTRASDRSCGPLVAIVGLPCSSFAASSPKTATSQLVGRNSRRSKPLWKDSLSEKLVSLRARPAFEITSALLPRARPNCPDKLRYHCPVTGAMQDQSGSVANVAESAQSVHVEYSFLSDKLGALAHDRVCAGSGTRRTLENRLDRVPADGANNDQSGRF